jgi:short-subunit dehydrogenase
MTTRMPALDGKVVFITGASSGIGAALAREFAAQGAHLVLAARRLDRLRALAAELQHASRRVLCYECDVTKDGDVERVVAAARDEVGPMDVVAANAGFGVTGRLEELDLADFRRQFETNVFGVLRTVYATLDDLKRTRGRLAVLGSIAGYIAVPAGSPYAMSKFAVRALSISLAGELAADGVSVTHVAPGFVESEIFQVDKHGVFDPNAPMRIPDWVRMPAPRAARKIVAAIRRRRREVIITLHGKVGVWLMRHLPWVVQMPVRVALAVRAKRDARVKQAAKA